MKTYRRLFTIALLTISSSLYAQEASESLGVSTGMIKGWGSVSCERVMAKTNPSEIFPIEGISWAQGYLTALSLTLRHDSSAKFDTKFNESGGGKKLAEIMKNYCMKDKNKLLEQVVFRLYRDWGGTALK